MTDKILLVEDDATLSMIVADTLRRDGFDVKVATDGKHGLELFAKYRPDIVVADVMMPNMDGFEMGRRLRKLDSEVPLLFLTAKSEIDDIVEGFELGANDYLKKPFKMLELIVRIKALLRRRIKPVAAAIPIGQYTFNPETQTLSFGDKSYPLSRMESVLLKELVENTGHTVEASVLMRLLWQRDDLWSRNSLHGFIHKLRHYFRHDPSISIINQRGFGYMLTVQS